VAVGVGLDDRLDEDAGTDDPADEAEVARERVEVEL
jgi:hypothetical protein